MYNKYLKILIDLLNDLYKNDFDYKDYLAKKIIWLKYICVFFLIDETLLNLTFFRISDLVFVFVN